MKNMNVVDRSRAIALVESQPVAVRFWSSHLYCSDEGDFWSMDDRLAISWCIICADRDSRVSRLGESQSRSPGLCGQDPGSQYGTGARLKMVAPEYTSYTLGVYHN